MSKTTANRKAFIQRIAKEVYDFWQQQEDEDIKELWDDIYNEIESKIGL
ncbi:MAG: hypothetical protein ACE5NN_03260 [Candidatus Bathyarchaeia archaeon]